jgi:signal transduction protein with GAF and PtsI domain
MEEYYSRKVFQTRNILLEMGSKRDRPDLFQYLSQEISNLFGADGSAIYIYEKQHHELNLVAIHNLREELKGAKVNADSGLLGQIVRSLKPMKIDNYNEWPERVKIFEEDQYKALAEAPIIWKNDLLGVVGLVRTGDAEPFSDFDLNLLGVIAIHLAATCRSLE